jgi:hypothetical protein
MKITVLSPKFGPREVLIDDEDFQLVSTLRLYLWSTSRHSGIYVHAYIPEAWYKPQRLHRVLMKAGPGEIGDHINGNPLDNRKSNLRIVTALVNNQNARKRRDGVTSRFKGVSWCKTSKKWKAQIQVCGHKKSLGLHTTEEAAARAYDAALDLYNVAGPRNLAELK